MQVLAHELPMGHPLRGLSTPIQGRLRLRLRAKVTGLLNYHESLRDGFSNNARQWSGLQGSLVAS